MITHTSPPAPATRLRVVDRPPADEDRDRGQDDSDLETGDSQGELVVLVELVPALGFQVLGLFLDVLFRARSGSSALQIVAGTPNGNRSADSGPELGPGSACRRPRKVVPWCSWPGNSTTGRVAFV